MEFEVTNALRDLDQQTPSYITSEIFAHGDLKVRLEALKVFRDLDPRQRTNRVLREWLKLQP